MSILTDKRRYLDQTTTLAIAQTVEITNLLRDRPIPELAYQLRRTMPAVSDSFANVASVISADSYNKSRTLARPPSEFKATPKKADTNKGMQAAIGFGIAQLTRGTDYDVFQSTLAGSVQRLVLDGDRETVELNIVLDPDGTRYERVASPDACAFCLTMAAVATTDENIREDFFDGYHNNCRCTLNPIFTGQSLTDPPYYDKARDAYKLANEELLKQQKAARRAFDARLRAQGQYTGGSRATTAFQRENPELSITTPNVLRLVRQITGQR
jgi:hypothetical protein